jgi:hypothetical protein
MKMPEKRCKSLKSRYYTLSKTKERGQQNSPPAAGEEKKKQKA